MELPVCLASTPTATSWVNLADEHAGNLPAESSATYRHNDNYDDHLMTGVLTLSLSLVSFDPSV
jgi:hypothetical protein